MGILICLGIADGLEGVSSPTSPLQFAELWRLVCSRSGLVSGVKGNFYRFALSALLVPNQIPADRLDLAESACATRLESTILL